MNVYKKVFLGGTYNGSTWREKLIPMLKIGFYNPVVPEWAEECYQEELRQRIECDYCLYVITPKIIGLYSIAEVVDDSNKRPEHTFFCYLEEDEECKFEKEALKSLSKIGIMIENNGGKCFLSLDEIANHLNNKIMR